VIIYEGWWWAPLWTLERHLYHTVIYTLIEIRLSLGWIIQCSRYRPNILGAVLFDLNLTTQEFRPRLMLAVCHSWRRCLLYLLLHRRAASLPTNQLLALLKYPSNHLFYELLLLFETSPVHFLPWRELLLPSSSSLSHTLDCFCIYTPYLNSYLWSIVLQATIANMKEKYYY
jgi:hypothetical protein